MGKAKEDMKIAFVIYNWSESKGGVERYAYDLARYLTKEGNEVHIFSANKDAAPAPGLIFHPVPAGGIFSYNKYSAFARNSARMLKEDRFDVIHGFGRTYYQDVYRVGSGCHWEYLKNRHPSTNNIFGRLLQYLNPRNQVIMHLEKKSFSRGAYKKVVCISHRVKQEVQAYYHIPDEDIKIIYNGIDLNRFNPGNREKYCSETRAKLGLSGGDIVLLFVGSGFERKGLQYAIESLALVPQDKRANLKLLVVGSGNIARYQSLAARHNIEKQVIFAGAQAQIERYYASGDVFLFPTLYEPFGTVCLEAMASGLPVITTRIAGASEVIADSIDSFVVDRPSDIRTIAEKIVFLLDPVWRKNMSKAAALTASKYSFENNFRQVKETYREIMNYKV
ncbi:MAG: glycosyltransferase family 4 protein [Planctomycetota bacterium]